MQSRLLQLKRVEEANWSVLLFGSAFLSRLAAAVQWRVLCGAAIALRFASSLCALTMCCIARPLPQLRLPRHPPWRLLQHPVMQLLLARSMTSRCRRVLTTVFSLQLVLMLLLPCSPLVVRTVGCSTLVRRKSMCICAPLPVRRLRSAKASASSTFPLRMSQWYSMTPHSERSDERQRNRRSAAPLSHLPCAAAAAAAAACNERTRMHCSPYALEQFDL